ncbi:MAG: RluA family pseudouridine synthase, partial [Clostridia bacterium]|nr:RluA family pseudouridine synthase [Clostridia bacterium]
MDSIILNVEEKQSRIDKYIADNSDISRSFAAKLCDEGNIIINGKCVQKKQALNVGDVIEITLPEPKSIDAKPENIPLNIVYEDNDVVVINKPQGMVVHPAPGHEGGTLVNALLYHCGDSLSAINGVVRPGIVHRIDKDTSGLLVVAKNNDSHMFLADQLKDRKALRRYYALVNGNISEDKLTIDKPIARHPKDRKKMTITEKNSRNAVTHYTVLERFDKYTLVKCRLETGRTHQIRVHMSKKGHPIVGDKTYGRKKEEFTLNGQLLHAFKVGYIHPVTEEYMEFERP